jgi:hypothetical protein
MGRPVAFSASRIASYLPADAQDQPDALTVRLHGQAAVFRGLLTGHGAYLSTTQSPLSALHHSMNTASEHSWHDQPRNGHVRDFSLDKDLQSQLPCGSEF